MIAYLCDGRRSDVAIRCQKSGRSFRSNAYSFLEGLSNAAYPYFGEAKTRFSAVRCRCGWCCSFESTVLYLRCTVVPLHYRPTRTPVSRSPHNASRLYASFNTCPRKCQSLGSHAAYRIQMELTPILVLLACCPDSRQAGGRFAGTLVWYRESVSNFPAAGSLAAWTITCIGPVRRIISPGSFVILLLSSPQ